MLHMKKCFSRIQVLTYDVKVCNGVPQPPGPRPPAAVVPSQRVQRERRRALVAEPV